jgi:hypothetical protein
VSPVRFRPQPPALANKIGARRRCWKISNIAGFVTMGLLFREHPAWRVQAVRVEATIAPATKPIDTITHADDEHLMEAMTERMKRKPEKFRLRKSLVEPSVRHDEAVDGRRALYVEGDWRKCGPNGV